jgi:hypothetical protein
MRADTHDPFGEFRSPPYRCQRFVLGAQAIVDSNSPRLLELLDRAFANLPRHRLRVAAPRLRLRLELAGNDRAPRARVRPPPPLRLRAAGGLLIGTVDADSYVIVDAGRRHAFVSLSPRLLAAPYHARYELIEFALLTLASRVLQLVPLHAAAVACGQRAALILGDSGAGKSTLTVAAIESGLSFVAEDAAFVDARSLRLTGCGNFLHLGSDSLRCVRDVRLRDRFRVAPRIRRRSGAQKRELDARTAGLPLAAHAPSLCALVLLSRRRARRGPLLRPLRHSEVRAKLRRLQPYAAQQPGWHRFLAQTRRIPVFLLLRGAHPQDGAAELHCLLANT